VIGLQEAGLRSMTENVVLHVLFGIRIDQGNHPSKGLTSRRFTKQLGKWLPKPFCKTISAFEEPAYAGEGQLDNSREVQQKQSISPHVRESFDWEVSEPSQESSRPECH